MKSKLRIVAVVAILAFCFVSCARMPKSETSAKLIRKHFKKYGKKFPQTVYGKSKVSEVEITGQSEIHKHFVAVESFVTLEGGEVRRIYATVEKGPFGWWKFVSWENVEAP
jgi:hypothetical protein